MSLNRIARRGTVAAAFGVVGLVVGGIGVAAASSGGVFILGEHNAATSVTTLSNSKGSALALKSKHGTAPLTVNSSKEVKHLNAAMVGGSTASSLKSTGSSAATNFPLGTVGAINTEPTAVAATAKLKKGTYYVTATATLDVPTDAGGYCTVLTTSPGTTDTQSFHSASTQTGLDSLSDTRPVTVSPGQKITEYCWIGGGSPSPSVADAAGITAIRVAASTKGKVIVGHMLL
jgi:hypothetical protein